MPKLLVELPTKKTAFMFMPIDEKVSSPCAWLTPSERHHHFQSFSPTGDKTVQNRSGQEADTDSVRFFGGRLTITNTFKYTTKLLFLNSQTNHWMVKLNKTSYSSPLASLSGLRYLLQSKDHQDRELQNCHFQHSMLKNFPGTHTMKMLFDRTKRLS